MYNIGITIDNKSREISGLCENELILFIENNKNDIYYISTKDKILYTEDVEMSAESYISNYSLLSKMYEPLSQFDIYLIKLFNK